MSKINIIKSNNSIQGAKCVGEYKFAGGNSVPIYEVFTVHELNQLVGYAKFLNREYGNVYYRGQCELYGTISPSIYRQFKKAQKADTEVNLQIAKITKDKNILRDLNISTDSETLIKAKIEGILQHYGAPTRFLDLVDNHWVSLWMGLFQYCTKKQVNTYSFYQKRQFDNVEKTSHLIEVAYENFKLKKEERLKQENKDLEERNKSLYQYLLLLAFPYGKVTDVGVEETDDFTIIDLRNALPSIFLRPHAQHALVIKKKGVKNDPLYYDVSGNVVGIVKIRIDRASEWLGNGTLMSVDNLFPSPLHDHGYDVLLSRDDLFEQRFKIVKYI